jgi:hypothetical protein
LIRKLSIMSASRWSSSGRLVVTLWTAAMPITMAPMSSEITAATSTTMAMTRPWTRRMRVK